MALRSIRLWSDWFWSKLGEGRGAVCPLHIDIHEVQDFILSCNKVYILLEVG